MSFSRQERINFSHFLRESFLFPILIIFLNVLQVSVLHVDSVAVEFNELWMKAEKPSHQMNEWWPLTPGVRPGPSYLALPFLHGCPDAGVAWVPRAAQLSSATHGSSLTWSRVFLQLSFLLCSFPNDLSSGGGNKPFVLLSPRECQSLTHRVPPGLSKHHHQLIILPGLPYREGFGGICQLRWTCLLTLTFVIVC